MSTGNSTPLPMELCSGESQAKSVEFWKSRVPDVENIIKFYCVDLSDAVIEGDFSTANKFRYISINYEFCEQQPDTSSCKTPQKLIEDLKEGKVQFYVELTFLALDMKDPD
mmetsp:Transcript_19933/g.26911  ORF Transcript_19933/g.26911 Transcript_19933/m.26911 type:complete len:111 (+) Transcript_19933:313-645(+)